MATPDAPGQRTATTALGQRLMAAALALPLATPPAQAESAPERGVVALKYLDYLDSQPGADRIRVRAPSLRVLVPLPGATGGVLGGDWSVGGTLTSDAISGASPAFHSQVLQKMRDERHAVEAELTRHLPHGGVTFGAVVSRESDYLSRGLSVLARRESEDRNTTWSAGLGVARDSISPNNGAFERDTKRVVDLLAGVTQVMGTHDIVQLNLAHRIGRGYFSDPYKVNDNRPRRRDSSTALLRWNHHVEATQTTARLSYRYYTDSYRIRAHTLGLELVQPLPRGWTVSPLVRLYTQGAASFYVDADPANDPFPPNPPDGAEFFSEDHRVSAFGALTLGLKVARQIGPDWTVDIKFERYAQRSAWQLFGSGSPGLAPFDARSVQVGVARQF
ncbi:DUF3570 domain-containing protein [Ideonella sp. A 288]|uniref:DUF3570 domain-containing protein n=1 Tax=Ideonella sp. A 288 TaxID=1962181 RepID=UPI001F1CE45E|nr:DUF3570 domain-containing protein [Ideonella sp. A 288]